MCLLLVSWWFLPRCCRVLPRFIEAIDMRPVVLETETEFAYHDRSLFLHSTSLFLGLHRIHLSSHLISSHFVHPFCAVYLSLLERWAFRISCLRYWNRTRLVDRLIFASGLQTIMLRMKTTMIFLVIIMILLNHTHANSVWPLM